MPEMTAGQRGHGGWVAGGVPNITHDLPTRHELCGYFEGGGVCDVLTEKRYAPGWRCPRHTPAALAGRAEASPDPARTAEALQKNRLRTPDQSRYGRATSTPA